MTYTEKDLRAAEQKGRDSLLAELTARAGGAGSGPLTRKQIASMTADEINERWEEVAAVMGRGLGDPDDEPEEDNDEPDLPPAARKRLTMQDLKNGRYSDEELVARTAEVDALLKAEGS